MRVPGQPEPIAVLRRMRFEGRWVFRAVSWAPTSAGRELIGYFGSGDAAAEAVWRRYVEQDAVRHDDASRTHGGRGRYPRS